MYSSVPESRKLCLTNCGIIKVWPGFYSDISLNFQNYTNVSLYLLNDRNLSLQNLSICFSRNLETFHHSSWSFCSGHRAWDRAAGNRVIQQNRYKRSWLRSPPVSALVTSSDFWGAFREAQDITEHSWTATAIGRVVQFFLSIFFKWRYWSSKKWLA